MGFHESTGLKIWPSTGDHLWSRNNWEFKSVGHTSLMQQIDSIRSRSSTLGEARVQTRGKPKSYVGVYDH